MNREQWMCYSEIMTTEKVSTWLLRFGIAGVFLYAGIFSLLYPQNWIGYLPTFIHGFIPDTQLLMVFSVYELGLAAWILSSKLTFWAASLACLTLVGIIIANSSDIDILFRDIAIIFAAAALAAKTFPYR